MIPINTLWHSNNDSDWKLALENYWHYVQPKNLELEHRLDNLKLTEIISMDPTRWYDFLHDEYFRWKYTAPNRYATTTRMLKQCKDSGQLDSLFEIKKRLFNFNVSDIEAGLSIAKEIPGLGIAGASGLLSLMYPEYFATVDQFVVKAFCQIPDLPESNEVNKMKPESLTLKDGVILTAIMQRKAKENNEAFGTGFWTPRKIDMVLWACR